MRFKTGDKVMAKWPGSALYFHAKITSINKDEGVAEVLFEDGTDMEVPIQNLATERAFTRRKSKSPARRRSRSRSPGRSPARQPRQKLVANNKKDTTEKSMTSSTSSSEEKKVAKVVSGGRSMTHRSARYEQKTEIKGGTEKVTTKTYQAEVVLKKISNDMPAQKTTKSVTFSSSSVKSERSYEFGGPFGVTLLYLTCPLLPLLLISACTSSSCDLHKFKLSNIPQNLSAYYDKTGALIIAAYFLLHALIYALPFGYVVDGPNTPNGKKTKYRISAFYSLFFTVVIFFALKYNGYSVTIVLEKLFPMMVMCTALSYVLNILLHIKSFAADESDLNPAANTGCTIYDMFCGRELHPKFGQYFQIKLFIYRPAMCAWVLMNLINLQKEFETNHTIRPSMAVVAGSQIFYCMFTFFLDEMQAIYSFDIKYEGVGYSYLFGNFVMVPFIYTSHCLYLVQHPKAILANPVLGTVVALIVAGIALIVLSGHQKSKFRQNPYDPSLSGLDSIPPSKKSGDRLLVSGFWGFVRHPNYLGEIIAGLGYGLACGFRDMFPWVYVMFVTVVLCHRALRDEKRCQEKHGYAWKEYCKRVRFRIFPYVY